MALIRGLIVVLVVVLAGCATRERLAEPASPVHVPESTWWQVDREIALASEVAAASAGSYARTAMEKWRGMVARRNESDFIPWFSGYWTQQWLAIKVAWYRLGSGEATDPAVRRLAAYLQEQYRERVLDPVAREVDPDLVRETATRLYVESLGRGVRPIPMRHGVPADQFDQRLRGIPAIALAPPPAHDASLHDLLRADPLAALPAYSALLARIRPAAGSAGSGPSEQRISPVAKRASEKLVARFAASGLSSAAAAAIGGVAGAVISLGALGIGALAHESQRPEMEAELRASLNAALDDMWHSQMDDPTTGVLAGVNYLVQRIDEKLSRPVTLPVELGGAPEELPLAEDAQDTGEALSDEEMDQADQGDEAAGGDNVNDDAE
ncbi:hypothetical protein [Accumulibacter sp.]|uniref:hypothetical protein n=1 Tax=Accumulibacter sp. TaxID=2053492 RepID=UPI0025DAC64C|nr:hypothetical protein [Accumulibacter sp.]MCM8594735.1 hypothetical protein [Accumulibacter sp.]MDS4048881.1 hypothetical protein [Accumulibacter sp.]